MLETLDLDEKIPKEVWKSQKSLLMNRFYNAAHALRQARIPTCILLEGWDLSGKGACIKFITDKQDPRGFRVEYLTEPRTREEEYHWLHRYWLKLPKYGEIVIFDTSWYRRVLSRRVSGVVTGALLKDAWRDINGFEKMMTDDCMIMLKFLLHISEKEQARRLEKLEKNPRPGFRVTEQEWGRHRQYGKLLDAVEDMLERTDKPYAPWRLIPATHEKTCAFKVMEQIVDAVEKVLAQRGIPLKPYRPVKEGGDHA